MNLEGMERFGIWGGGDGPAQVTCACGTVTLPWFDWKNWKEGDPPPPELIEFDNATHSYTGCEIHRPV
jgi:hypothetical protein